MWTGVLQTGTAAGDYSPSASSPTRSPINTIAVPAVTKKVTMTKLVPTIKNGKKLVRNGNVVTAPRLVPEDGRRDPRSRRVPPGRSSPNFSPTSSRHAERSCPPA